MTNHKIELSRGTDRLPGEPKDEQMAAWLKTSLTAMQEATAAVSLRIVSSEEMTQLNGKYGQAKTPTNVLAFPNRVTLEGDMTLLGDIAVCSKIIQEESERYQTPFQDRYAHLLVHGLLHLLGFDHSKEADRLQMESKEKELLATLGMAEPY
ncbi:MAG: rRNA maturation RNase YbeY [Pseudomonadales bacterium]